MILALALALLLSADPITVVPQRTDAPAVLSEKTDGFDSVFTIDLPSAKKYELKFTCDVRYTVPLLYLIGPSVTVVRLRNGSDVRAFCVLMSWTAQPL